MTEENIIITRSSTNSNVYAVIILEYRIFLNTENYIFFNIPDKKEITLRRHYLHEKKLRVY